MTHQVSNVPQFPSGAGKTAKRTLSTLQKELLTQDEWLRLAAQGSQLGLWYWDEVGQRLFWDRKTHEIFGLNPDGEVTLEMFYEALHPDDLARVRRVWRHQVESGLPYEVEYRVQRPDSSIRWIHARGIGYYEKAGKPNYMIGVIFDIAEHKEAEQERLEISGRLINAQEEERRHLAQDIHDDFGQRLAVLSMELQRAAELTKGTKAGQLVVESVQALAGLMQDFQSLSHRLYSSGLDILGPVPSIRSICVEFARQHGVQVTFDHADVPEQIPADVALCVFRIVQEGLHNVSKHSGASKVEVRLNADRDVISLTVFDNGKGFDLTKNFLSKGIGVQSMRERALWLGGRFEIQSRPAREGTQIAVTLPLKRVRGAEGKEAFTKEEDERCA